PEGTMRRLWNDLHRAGPARSHPAGVLPGALRVSIIPQSRMGSFVGSEKILNPFWWLAHRSPTHTRQLNAPNRGEFERLSSNPFFVRNLRGQQPAHSPQDLRRIYGLCGD